MRDDIHKLYVSSKEGGRGLVSIEDSVDASMRGLEEQRKTNYGAPKQYIIISNRTIITNGKKNK